MGMGSLRVRALAIVLASIVGLTGLSWWLFAVVSHDRFMQIEHKQVVESVRRVEAAFAAETDDLRVRSEDWAYWDDAVDFIHNGTDRFASNLAEESLAVVNVDIALFADINGKLKLGLDTLPSFQSTRESTPRLDEIGNFALSYAQSALKGTATTGVTSLEGQPLLFSAVPILTNVGDGPPQGYVVFGRLIDDAFIDGLRKNTRMRIEMWQRGDQAVPIDVSRAFSDPKEGPIPIVPVSEDLIRGYGSVKNFRNDLALYFRVDEPRPIFLESLDNTRNGVMFFLGGSLLIGALMLWTLQTTVIRGIVFLGKEMAAIRESRDISRRVEASGIEEIRKLAESANFMLESLQLAQLEIKEGRDMLQKQAIQFAEQVEKLSISRQRIGQRKDDIQRLTNTAIIQVEAFSMRSINLLDATIAKLNEGVVAEKDHEELRKTLAAVVNVCKESRDALKDTERQAIADR